MYVPQPYSLLKADDFLSAYGLIAATVQLDLHLPFTQGYNYAYMCCEESFKRCDIHLVQHACKLLFKS